MSISSIRKSTEKKGCQIALIGIGVLMAVGMAATGMFGGPNQQQGSDASQVAFTIQGQEISKEDVEQAANGVVQNQSAQFGMPVSRTTPATDFGAVSTALGQIVNRAVLRNIASDRGATVSDDVIRDTMREQLEMSIQQVKLQLQIQQGLEPDAVDEEFAKIQGRSAEQIISDQMAQLDEDLQNPAARQQYESMVLAESVLETYQAEITITEEQLRADYDSFELQEVAFNVSDLTGDELMAEAERAREELVNGADIAAVQEKYAPESEQDERPLPRGLLTSAPDYAPILALEPGDVSPVMTLYGYPSVFVLKEIKSNVPDDFEENKAQLLEQRTQQEASSRLQEELNERQGSVNIEWVDKGLEMIWKVAQVLSDPANSDPDTLSSKLSEVQSEIRAIEPTNETNMQYLALANYAVAETMINLASEEERDSMVDSWMGEVNNILGYYDNAAVRMEIYQRLKSAERPEDAFVHLYEAARLNRDFEAEGQQIYARISTEVEAGKEDGSMTEDQVAQLEEELSLWLSGQAEYDREMEELLRQQEEIQNELDQEVVGDGETDAPGITPESTGNDNEPAEATTTGGE